MRKLCLSFLLLLSVICTYFIRISIGATVNACQLLNFLLDVTLHDVWMLCECEFQLRRFCVNFNTASTCQEKPRPREILWNSKISDFKSHCLDSDYISQSILTWLSRNFIRVTFFSLFDKMKKWVIFEMNKLTENNTDKWL